jgi:hypothetical protein
LLSHFVLQTILIGWHFCNYRFTGIPVPQNQVSVAAAANDGDGALIYQHACALGCEGIVSKRLGSPYRAGRTDQWLKMKNPAALSRPAPRS